MDQSKALHRLREAADLVGMIEDLLDPSRTESLSPASWAGMRVTLKGIRESMVESHTVLTRDLVNRARGAAQTNSTEKPQSTTNNSDQIAVGKERNLGESPIQRRTLASSMERFSGQ